ncbi:hypothetical protein GCM10011581_14180 [Saccharopolyspora subtropica]|uniref:Uncharacterized protein n=1 Tax=Saccharopolyspora thermophila TaxID=89367 RepID=A0A917JPE6_9PSEU|nr:hypothetical protein GCM10011581_14180 [Saccharopolyspora subtropica]
MDATEAVAVVLNGVTTWKLLHRTAAVRSGQTVPGHGVGGGGHVARAARGGRNRGVAACPGEASSDARRGTPGIGAFRAASAVASSDHLCRTSSQTASKVVRDEGSPARRR